jgi:hypothetical protein
LGTPGRAVVRSHRPQFVLEAQRWRLVDLAEELIRIGDEKSAQSLAILLLGYCAGMSLEEARRLDAVAGQERVGWRNRSRGRTHARRVTHGK